MSGTTLNSRSMVTDQIAATAQLLISCMEDIRTMRKSLLFLAFVLISSIVVSAQQEKNSDKDQKKPAKISVDELIARHIASIGPADVIAGIKSRVMVGEGKL